MIKYEWRDNLSAAESTELADLLQRAAVYDAEPEYNTIDFAGVEAAMSQPDSRARHLLIWMLPHATTMNEPEGPERIAGLVRLLSTSDSAVEATVVIDPDLRSIGIVTLLLEQIGLDTSLSDGWLGTAAQTVTAWARGNHPAAERLSNRFLIPRTRRMWKLIRYAAAEDAPAAPVLEPLTDSLLDGCGWAKVVASTRPEYALREGGRVVGAIALDPRPVPSEEFGCCATVEHAIVAPDADVRVWQRLLQGAAAIAHDAGRTGVIIYVDSNDADLVNACRLSGFQHDRTDVRYELGRR